MKPLLAIRALVLMSVLAISFPVLAAEPIRVDGGLIKGTVEDGVQVFKGVPFAATTAGENRWRPPQPVASWEGTRECVAYGPDCPQAPYPKESIYYRAPGPQSEDCLSLNIWSAAAPGEKRPVMVWIHGGALTRGSGSVATYDGGSLAKKSVVLVTINYRLGPLGYLAHPELTAESEHKSSGNYGVLDQIAALQWVHRNIAAFGGDPGCVTIFGESAGSWSVNVLVATPLARGLFHRAIGESGAQFSPGTPLSQIEESGATFGKACGANSLADMRALPVEKIMEVFSTPAGAGFRTRVGTDGWVLPQDVHDTFATGKHNDVPVIVGSNANEMTSLTPISAIPKTLAAYEQRAKAFFGAATAGAIALYPAKTDADAGRAFLGVSRDITFTQPMRAWARATIKGKSKAYLYQFTRVPPVPNREYLGAFHAAEIAYAFDNLTKSPRKNEPVDFNLAKTMSAYWVNFARTGDPNGEGLPKWEPYNEKDEPYLDLGETVALKNHLLKKELDFIEQHPVAR